MSLTGLPEAQFLLERSEVARLRGDCRSGMARRVEHDHRGHRSIWCGLSAVLRISQVADIGMSMT